MRSLAAHLRETDAHDRLPFHPSCPICRQTRLTGQLPTDELVSPRAQALLAAGVLAMSASAPGAAAVAAEQDQQQDGTAAVGQNGATDPADSPDFDPGGEGTGLPETALAVPQNQAPVHPANDDTGPVDQTATTDSEDPVVDPGDGSDGTPTAPAVPAQPPATPTNAPAPRTPTRPPARPSSDSTPPPSAPPEAATPVQSPPAAVPRAVRRASRSSRAARRSHKSQKVAQRGGSRVSAAPAVAVTAPGMVPVTAAAPTAARVAASEPRAKPGDRTHTVLRGESLWTIAADLLGGEASTAKVAREVHRLWQLNGDRIATGDPDLLMVGTRLDLR
jgi:hypothetical protein